jgi:alpha-glucosidase
MQISFRPTARQKSLAKIRSRSANVLAAALLLSTFVSAQTLARPGWVGSGLTSQTWWQSAVIYRVQPQSFQDSDGDGVGDLSGLALRLNYLQSIGVDAVLLESHANELSHDGGFDDLLSDASRHHIRILVELGDSSGSQVLSADQTLSQARMWLRRGVAGVYVPASLLSAIAARSNFHEAVFLLQELRTLVDSFPGERIVIAGDSPAVSAAAAASPHGGPQIVDGILDASTWDAAALRTKLLLADSPSAGEPLLQIAPHSEQQRGRDKILAALLLSSRGAVGLTYGQEIGLANTAATAIMQWTPTNVTRPQEAAAPKPKEEVYGPYRPYVPPAPSSMIGSRPHLPSVELNTESAPPPVDPDTLPGFSTRAMTSVENAADKTNNVAVEDSNSESLLNFYRRVLELHSSNATLRTGSVSFLNHDTEGAMVWLRRAPAGARTVASVIVACNLTDHPTQLSLDADLARLHIAAGVVRPLLTSVHADHVAQSTGYLRLSPHSVYVGELYHR